MYEFQLPVASIVHLVCQTDLSHFRIFLVLNSSFPYPSATQILNAVGIML